MNASRRAFTLVELLVVIAIIGVLVALLLPAIQAARESARRAQCTNNEKQLGVAFHNYEGAYKSLPAGSLYSMLGVNWQDQLEDGEKVEWNWVTAVLPFMEQANVKDQFNMVYTVTNNIGFPNVGPANNPSSNAYKIARTVIPGLICPSSDFASTPIFEDRVTLGLNPQVAQGLWYTASMGPTIPDQCVWADDIFELPLADAARVCMGCNFGTEEILCARCYAAGGRCRQDGLFVGMFGRTTLTKVKFRQVSDGLSNTWMAGETLPEQWRRSCIFCNNFPLGSTHIPINTFEIDEPFPVVQPVDIGRTCGYKSRHPGGVNMLLGDGSVRFVQETIDYFVWNEYGTTAAGESAKLED
jgi:prepilin-type N-terminal cleavage/methylation domain-containing protein/prepilin-type processing-associated H-X9-DG protein